MVAAAPDYLARHPRPTTPRDLKTHNCIRFRFPSGVIVPWQFEKKGTMLTPLKNSTTCLPSIVPAAKIVALMTWSLRSRSIACNAIHSG
jgi:hypothetical protein